MGMTITEALAEIKLISNKINKKKEWINGNLVRYSQSPDPHEKEGGTKAKMSQELQAVKDLQDRLVTIRSEIMRANINSIIEVMGEKKSIYQWLVWRKEIAHDQAHIYNNIYVTTKRQMESYAEHPKLMRDQDNPNSQPIIVTMEANVDYQDYHAKHAWVSEVLDKLDGILSLKNATITIDV